MLIRPPIPELWLFQNLTLKIKGQGHGWGHSSKSQCGSNILSTHIPFVPCQSALPFLRYSIFKIWPWKSKFKVIAQDHKVGITPYRFISLSFRVDRPSHSWDTVLSKFDLENPNVKVIAQGHTVGITPYRLISLSFHVDRPSHSWDTVLSKFDLENHNVKVIAQGHTVGITPYRLISLSFHVDRPSHSWVTTFSTFNRENQGSRSWVRSQFKITMWVYHPIDSHPFRSMSIGPPIP